LVQKVARSALIGSDSSPNSIITKSEGSPGRSPSRRTGGAWHGELAGGEGLGSRLTRRLSDSESLSCPPRLRPSAAVRALSAALRQGRPGPARPGLPRVPTWPVRPSRHSRSQWYGVAWGQAQGGAMRPSCSSIAVAGPSPARADASPRGQGSCHKRPVSGLTRRLVTAAEPDVGAGRRGVTAGVTAGPRGRASTPWPLARGTAGADPPADPRLRWRHSRPEAARRLRLLGFRLLGPFPRPS
jgi:hypothetical protein